MASQIQVRRDTLANWNSNDPVLANGEIGFVIDENKFKVGNGTDSFTELPYLQADAYIDSVVLGTDTTGNYAAQVTGTGSGISVTGSGESASVVIENTGVTSLAGTTNEVEVSASTGAVTISLPSTINANTTGSAASLTTARTISLGGDLSGSASFDGTSNITITASVDSQSSVNSIAGTENEITVSASVGDITLSLPSTINANTTGTAASLTTARTIALSGDVSGSVTFDGSASVDIATQIQPNSVELGTDTAGNYVTQVTGTGAGISVTGSGESASVVIENTGVTTLSGTANEVEVSASTGSVTISLPSTINANTTGSAATLTNARAIALSGDLSGSANFDGSASISINADIQPNSVVLGTDTTGNYVATASAGSGISISGSGSEDAAITISNTGVTSLAGTANQIAVSASNGDATLSFPSAVTFPGTVTLNGNPGQALEAATKQYVDAIAEGLHIHASVATATTASVDLNDAPAAIDGVNLTDGMRILVKNQSNTADNGIYTYSASADALVRASDFNSSTEIQGGDFLFVTSGNTYENTGWVQTETVTTLGTDPILFTQFSGAGTYSAGTGLQLDGTVFSNTGVLSLAGTTNEIEVSASNGSITISLPSTINANTTGSAASLTTSRTIELTGDVTGSASFNGGANASISASIAPNSVQLGTDTNGDYVSSVSASGSGISVTGTGEGAAVSIENTGVTSLSGTENEITVSASSGSVTLSLPETINANTTGTAASLTTARTIALSGDVSGSASFDGSASAGITATLANTAVSASSYGSASAVGTFTVDSKGRLTAASNTPITIDQSAVTNLTSDLAAKAPSASPTFTGTANFAQAPTIGTSGSATTITVDGTIITQLRDTFTMYAPFSGQNALQWFYSSTIPQVDIDVVQSILPGQQITVFDGTSTYTFTATGPGDQDEYGANVLMIPGSGTSSGYYSTGAYATIPGAPAPILVAATSQTGNSGKYLTTNGTKATWSDPFASPSLTGTPTAPTADSTTDSTQIATTEFVQNVIAKLNIITQSGSYILNNGDEGKTIEMTSASANNLTIPLDSSQPIPIGSTIDVIQYGAGQTTIVATSGVTIRSKDGNLKLSGQYSGATLYKRHFNEWVVVGDLTS